MFSKLTQIMSQPSIAVDLGTANTRVYASELGKVSENPSAIGLVNKKINTISDEYFKFINSKIATTPLRGGVIVDLKNTIALLRPLIKKTRRFFNHPISLACAPTDTSEDERDLLANALIHAGASHVSIIPEVWAAAIGAGIDITRPSAQLLIDIGDGVTDMAVFRDGRIVFTSAIRTACSDLQKAVRSAIMAKHKIQLYAQESERLTHEILSISNQQGDQGKLINVLGMDIVKRCEVNFLLDNQDVIHAMAPVLDKIIRMIEISLKKLPEEIYCEILESGICLTGGGACINGLDRLIAMRTNIDVRVASDPIHAVINGAIQTLDYWKGEKNWWKNIAWPKLSS